MQNMSVKLIDSVERLVLQLLLELNNCGTIQFKVPNDRLWMNYVNIGKKILGIRPEHELLKRTIDFGKKKSRHHFTLMVYVLAEVHRLQLIRQSCTSRSLYYRNVYLIQSQMNITSAKMDICRLLNMTPCELGILSAVKGLIAGDIQFYMINGDIIDCRNYEGPMSLPPDFSKVDRLNTRAEFVLLVEKESVFDNLLACKIFTLIGCPFILLTGKGYPDFSTRRIVYHLNQINCIPVYAIFDADPFGIDIMLVYRHGSRAMGFRPDGLASQNIRWIGLHPSELPTLNVSSLPLIERDYKKIDELLGRNYVCSAVQNELKIMLQRKEKFEIESVLSILISDYIPNKMERNLFI